MIDLSGVQHHHAMRDIVNVLQNRTQNTDFSFFQAEVAYFLSKMAACMRASIITKDRGEIPVNTYAIGLASSGYGKGHSINVMENEFLAGFQRRFVEQTMALKAEEALHRIAKKKADQSLGTTEEITEEEAFKKLMDQYERKGKYLFTFDSGTMPAVKQLRQKLLMAEIGSINFQMDEIGLNLVGNSEVMTVYLELYDQGMTKEKLTKNTEENERGDEMVGKTPANMLAFGTPSKLLDGSASEEHFFAFLDTGYARRCLFGWGHTSRNKMELDDAQLDKLAEQVFSALTDPQMSATIAQWAFRFSNLADPRMYGWKMTLDDDVAKRLIKYKLACEIAASKLPENEEIRRAEISHRYFKALKLAGAYAFIDESVEVEMDHLMQAILLVEESGRAFEELLKRPRAYVRLAKYISDIGTEVTHADLDEALPFYKRSSRNEQMQLAQAWGARNHILIKKAYRDGVEWFKADSLKDTDLSKVTISYSDHFAYNYFPKQVPFEKLHLVALSLIKEGPDAGQPYNWCNHHFRQEHRSEDNVIPGFNLIVLDVDKDTSLVQACQLMKPYKYFVYTTKRHTDTENRFRMVLPIKYTLNLDSDDYREFMSNVMAWLPFPIDDQANQRSRKWFSNSTKQAGYNIDEATVLDPLRFIPKTARNDEFQKEYKAISNYSNLERWFAMQMGVGNRNNTLLRYGMVLAESGLQLQEVEKMVMSFNEKVQPSLSKGEIQATVMKTVAKKYNGKKP